MEELIARARANWEENHEGDSKDMMLPLIRLKVETSEAKEMTNPVRFGQDFMGRVANPRDILQYYRRKKIAERSECWIPLSTAVMPDGTLPWSNPAEYDRDKE